MIDEALIKRGEKLVEELREAIDESTKTLIWINKEMKEISKLAEENRKALDKLI